MFGSNHPVIPKNSPKILEDNTISMAQHILQRHGLIDSVPYLNYDYNVESSSIPSSGSYKSFGDLKFNSVEEEEEFLYGEAHPISEKKKPSAESITNQTEARETKIENKWSDEDSNDDICYMKCFRPQKSKMEKSYVTKIPKDGSKGHEC